MNGAYGVVVTQRSVDPLSPVRIRLGTHARKNANCLAFFLAWVSRSHVFLARKTGEAGSRKFLSDDEEIIRDPRFNKQAISGFDFSVLL